jgi:AcrR family transcriptional regulator
MLFAIIFITTQTDEAEGKMDGFTRRKEQSKEDIRRAAEELFSRFGADRVSVNDIARKAGVSQATIYNNFGSKNELVKDYQHSVIRILATRFRGILLWKKSWVEKLQGAIQSWLDVADQFSLEVKTGAPLLSQEASPGKEAATGTENVRAELEKAFKEFLQEGRAQGSLRRDVSDEAIITYIRFFQQSLANNPAVNDRMRHDARFSKEMLSLFIYGITGKRQ